MGTGSSLGELLFRLGQRGRLRRTSAALASLHSRLAALEEAAEKEEEAAAVLMVWWAAHRPRLARRGGARHRFRPRQRAAARARVRAGRGAAVEAALGQFV